MLHALAQPGRHAPRPRARPRRPPHARHEDQLLRASCTTSSPYGVDPETFLVDMDEVARARARAQARRCIIAGWSAYPRQLDFARLPRDRRRGRRLAAGSTWPTSPASSPPGLHPSPVPHADVGPSTVHKTIGGPRAGFILTSEEHAKKINSAVFPGQQGGPLMHVIAAKAVAFKLAATAGVQGAPGAHARGAQTIAERAPRPTWPAASTCSPAAPTCTSCSSTCATSELDGQQAEDLLHEVGITVNRNAVPFDPRPPMVTSGLRIGAARSRRAASGAEDSPRSPTSSPRRSGPASKRRKEELAERARAIADRYPLYEHLPQGLRPDATPDPRLLDGLNALLAFVVALAGSAALTPVGAPDRAAGRSRRQPAQPRPVRPARPPAGRDRDPGRRRLGGRVELPDTRSRGRSRRRRAVTLVGAIDDASSCRAWRS